MMNEMNTMLLRLLNGGGGGVGVGAGVGASDTPDRETVVDGDGLFPSCEMTEIILSGTNEHVIGSSDVNAEADEADEADEAAAGETHESDEIRTLEPTTDYTYDEYDKRHFIEPISLVVSEL